jgi:Bacterial PH domain
MLFPAKRDWSWDTAILLNPWSLLPSLRGLGSFPLGALLLGVVIVGWLCMVWTLASTKYEIGDSKLIVYAGPFRNAVPLRDIFAVVPTHCSTIGSLAWSCDAITIRFYMNRVAGNSFEIAPRDSAGFLAAIADRCPQLAPSGTGLKWIRSPEAASTA